MGRTTAAVPDHLLSAKQIRAWLRASGRLTAPGGMKVMSIRMITALMTHPSPVPLVCAEFQTPYGECRCLRLGAYDHSTDKLGPNWRYNIPDLGRRDPEWLVVKSGLIVCDLRKIPQGHGPMKSSRQVIDHLEALSAHVLAELGKG